MIRLEDQPVGMHEVHCKLARSVCLQQVPPHRLVRWHGRQIGRCLQGAKPGAVPMEDMDLVVNPARRMVTVDPASPNLPHARVKQGHTTL